MNHIFKLIAIGFGLLSLYSGTVKAQSFKEVAYPCSVLLQPVRELPNAKGTALIAKVKKPYTNQPKSSFRVRESVGIYADWLPSPSAFGEYDQYEGFAQIPNVISWRFKLYPVKEDRPSAFGGTPWVGKFDELSSGLAVNTKVELRLSNSRTNKLGPVILQSTLTKCNP